MRQDAPPLWAVVIVAVVIIAWTSWTAYHFLRCALGDGQMVWGDHIMCIEAGKDGGR